jgi:hypothetical protein
MGTQARRPRAGAEPRRGEPRRGSGGAELMKRAGTVWRLGSSDGPRAPFTCSAAVSGALSYARRELSSLLARSRPFGPRQGLVGRPLMPSHLPACCQARLKLEELKLKAFILVLVVVLPFRFLSLGPIVFMGLAVPFCCFSVCLGWFLRWAPS